MKKLLILVWAIMPFLFLSKANAQLSFTPHFGVNYSKMIWNGIDTDTIHSYLTTPTLGLTSKYNFSKKWAAELGVQYSGKGFRSRNSKNAQKTQYIDFMPAVEYSPNHFLSFYSGLNFGISTGYYYRLKDTKWNKISAYIEEIFDYNKVDFGGLIGVRLKIKKIILGVHYNHSVTPVRKSKLSDENGEFTKPLNEYQQNFQLTLGYQINVKKK